jgi:hypothetical protein
MLKTESKAIGQHTYEFTQLETSKGLDLLPAVLRTLGPVGVEFLTHAEKFKSDGDEVPPEVLTSLLQSMLGVQSSDLKQISATLAAKSRVSGANGVMMNLGGSVEQPGVYEIHFPERWNEWAQWLWFALVTQYRSFLGGLPSGMLGQLGATPKAP